MVVKPARAPPEPQGFRAPYQDKAYVLWTRGRIEPPQRKAWQEPHAWGWGQITLGTETSASSKCSRLLRNVVSDRQQSTVACGGSLIKSANPPVAPNECLRSMVCPVSRASPVFDTCAEVPVPGLSPLAIESCLPRISQKLNMLGGVLERGLLLPSQSCLLGRPWFVYCIDIDRSHMLRTSPRQRSSKRSRSLPGDTAQEWSLLRADHHVSSFPILCRFSFAAHYETCQPFNSRVPQVSFSLLVLDR